MHFHPRLLSGLPDRGDSPRTSPAARLRHAFIAATSPSLGLGSPPVLHPRCNGLKLKTPASYAELEAAVRNWIATCVMSRTPMGGVPVHRERELVNGNASLVDIWGRILRYRSGQEVTIIPEYRWRSGGVESIRFTTTATPPPPPACRYDIRNAYAIEREAARGTLALSADVARRFIRTVGAVSARGRFVPTVIDNKYWFAKLYEFITFYEIGEAPRFRHPAFVLHFITIFYDLYYRALENWNAGNRGAVSGLWTSHFTRASRPDNSSIRGWMYGVQSSIVTGVTAHVQGDMATALERTYRSFVAKYCLRPPPRFDDFHPDFFEGNRIVFDKAKGAFLLHLPQFGPFPVGPEVGQFLFATGEPLAGGLDVGEVYRWRDAAWAEARRRLGQ